MDEATGLEAAIGGEAPIPGAPSGNSEIVAPVTTSQPPTVGLTGSELATMRGASPAMLQQAQEQLRQEHIYDAFTPEQMAQVPEGAQARLPDGSIRTKPYTVRTPADMERVPEGAHALTPDGKVRQKPKFEPITYTSQTLYDMTLNDKERKKVLENAYGRERVKQDGQGFYVQDEDGTLRRPGRGTQAAVGAVGAAALPVGLSVGGTVGGAMLGGLAGPAAPAAVPALATLFGGVGGASGQAANDFILGWSGAKDRSPWDEFGNLGTAFLTSMFGAGSGRAIAAAAPWVKEGAATAVGAIPALARKMLGTTPEGLAMQQQLHARGAVVPPSGPYPGSAHLRNVLEIDAPAMNPANPLRAGVEADYDRQAGQILADLGVPEYQGARRTADPSAVGPFREIPALLEPESAVSVRRAGQALKDRATADLAAADDAMENAIAVHRARGDLGAASIRSREQEMARASAQSREAADRLIQQQYADIGQMTEDGFRAAQAGHNSGEFFQAVGDRLRETRQGITVRGQLMYRQGDEMFEQLAPGMRPNIEEVSGAAQQVLRQLPEDFQRQYPGLVHRLAELGEGVAPSFGELRQIRSLLRHEADWSTLSSDFKNGALKHMEHSVDRALHNVDDALRPAVAMMDAADAFWRENIPVFRAKEIQAVMRGLQAGEPADPAALYKLLIRPDQTDMTNRLREMLGPQLWRGIQSADLQTIMRVSADGITPGVIDGGKFVKEVAERNRSGVLAQVHGPEGAERLARQAEAVRALGDARIPIQTNPNDTFAEVIMRTRAAAEAAERAATTDPLRALENEVRKATIEERRLHATARKSDELGALARPTIGAEAAANQVLNNPDLLWAVANRYGRDSQEMKLLQQAYTQRVLQGSINPGEHMGTKMTEELQQLMFPGVTGKQMKTLAEEMKYLTQGALFGSGDTGNSIAAATKVRNPMGKIISTPAKAVPGANMTARGVWEVYFSLMRRLITEDSPFTRMVKFQLERGPESREALRAAISKYAEQFAPYGAGGAALGNQQAIENRPVERQPAPRTVH